MQAQDNGGAVFPSYSELQVQFSNRPLDEKASRSTVRTCSMMPPGASLAAACKTRSPICWRRCAKRRTASLISIDGINLRCRNLCHLWFQSRKYRQGRVKSGISVSWLRRFGRSIWGVADVVTALSILAHMFIKTVFIDIWSERVDDINILRLYV